MQDLQADVPDAGKILLHNVYGWFDRAERGIYVLTDAGRAALKRWPQQPIGVCGRQQSNALADGIEIRGTSMIVVTGSVTDAAGVIRRSSRS